MTVGLLLVLFCGRRDSHVVALVGSTATTQVSEHLFRWLHLKTTAGTGALPLLTKVRQRQRANGRPMSQRDDDDQTAVDLYVSEAYHDRSHLDPISIIGFLKRERTGQHPVVDTEPTDFHSDAIDEPHSLPVYDRAGRDISSVIAGGTPADHKSIGLHYSKTVNTQSPRSVRFLETYAEPVAKSHAILGRNVERIMEAMVTLAVGTQQIRHNKKGEEVGVFDVLPDGRVGLALLDRALGKPAVVIEKSEETTTEDTVLYLPDNGRDDTGSRVIPESELGRIIDVPQASAPEYGHQHPYSQEEDVEL